ncbi:hypothetical protein OIU79_017802 [Salix purpurea]|uniref:Phototropic-responsive NPH3 family protein n=1 Tax=Salix purpurea TaxID=77065 RepID=A0A9Q1AKN2_SALPP|nr:hypothetical protein OIU79_017802 [Salix purpurea]
MEVEKPGSKGQAWFCTTGLPSDIVIEVEDMTFHLHKFPLMSKSRRLHQLITEQETDPTTSTTQREDEEERDEIEEIICQISLLDFPGGSESFEMAAKFCYGVKVDLNSSIIAPLRCAGEFLDMTEEYSEDNLISRTERFFSQSVLTSLKESIKALKSCERVMPLAESLGITERCIDSIASRASSVDPALFGWPVSEAANENNFRARSNQALWKEIESTLRRKGSGAKSNNADSWFEDLTLLSLQLFKRLILGYENGRSESGDSASEGEQREVLETIVSNLPLQKSSRSSTTTRFLFGLLRTANILNAAEECRSTLEKKIGLQLEQATLDDLLIPSYSYLNETLYDVDCLERILGHFLDGLEEERNGGEIEAGGDGGGGNVRLPTLMVVGKLIDGYLAEIGSDANLKSDRFYNLAISLPEQARLFDDGLYRAVDVYLKSHPWTSEAEREKICGIMDCQKLTIEACTHAAQNERLPLRAVVQVLFFEQIQLRHAITGTLIAAGADSARPSLLRLRAEEEEIEAEEGATQERNSNAWRGAARENQVLRLDMDSMRTRVHQLERECSNMKKVIEKIDKECPRQNNGGWRGSLTRRFGCKFKTQVCDSHEQTVVNARKGRQPHHLHQQ